MASKRKAKRRDRVRGQVKRYRVKRDSEEAQREGGTW